MVIRFDTRRVLGVAAGLPRHHHADSPAPFGENVHHVRVAELHPNGTATRAFGVVALKVAIDAAIGGLEWHTLFRPRAHPFESRTDDANEMTIVLATEIRLDGATIVVVYSHRTSPENIRVTPSIVRTSSAPESSIPCATPRRMVPSASNSMDRPSVADARRLHSLRIRASP